MSNEVKRRGKPPKLRSFSLSSFMQHFLNPSNGKYRDLSQTQQHYFKAMIISRSYTFTFRHLLNNKLLVDLVRYNQCLNQFKLRLRHSSTYLDVCEQFLIKFFVLIRPRRFTVFFGYDERLIGREVIDAMRGCSELEIHSKHLTNSISYALEQLGGNLDYLHCSITEFIRRFIDVDEPKLRFRKFSGTEGTLNHVLAFPVEEIEMKKEIFEYKESEPCSTQLLVKDISLKCKFEDFDKLYSYMFAIKSKVPNLKLLFWNAEYNSNPETISPSNLTQYLIQTVDSVLAKLRQLSALVPHLSFKFHKSLRLLGSGNNASSIDDNEWSKKLEKLGYFVENNVDVQLFNDPHVGMYQKNVKFEYKTKEMDVLIGIGVMLSNL